MAQITDETRRQGARLRALREQRGWSKPLLAGRLGFEVSQSLDLYERGKSVIRLDQLQHWADAFEMSVLDFSAAIFGPEPIEAAPWSLESELRAAGVDDELIRQTLDAGHSEPELIQKALARHAIAIFRSGHYRGENDAPARLRA